MKTNQYPRKKKFLAFLLSTLMIGSTAFGFASCTDDSSSSSSDSSSDSPTEEYVETNLIKNAGFENHDDAQGLKPIGVSPANWSLDRDSDRDGKATSSSSASGIINTSTDFWKDLTETTVVNPYQYTEAEIAEKWSTMSTRDKLEYYKAWKADDDNDKRKISELSFYQSFNIDDEDLPVYRTEDDKWVGIENPRTHDYTADSETDEDYNSNVLMLHNNLDKSTYIGTATKAVSDSKVTLKAGTSAILSLWVKTAHLQGNLPDGATAPSVWDLGAYIQISNTVGGATLDPIEVKNINTENTTADLSSTNGWQKFEFYLKGSYYVDSTFSVTLGLGHGGNKDKLDYVNGYAFFDDIQYEVIENSDYDALVDSYTTIPELGVNAGKEDKVLHANELDNKNLAINFYGLDADFEANNLLNETGWNIAPTTENNVIGVQFTAVEASDIALFPSLTNAQTYAGLGFDAENDRYAVIDSVQVLANGNSYEKAVYESTFKDKEFLTNEKALMLFSAKGVNYTAKSPEFSVEANTKLLLSFFVKTSAMHGVSGASITLNDGLNKTSFNAIDTTAITATTVGDKEIYEGWQQCLFFINNTTDSAQDVSLTFNFGSTAILGTSASAYKEGFAVFSGFKTKTLSNQEFTFASETAYAKVVTLNGDDASTGAGDSGFDTATNLQSQNIKDGFAIPQNYKGVYSDSMYVNSANSSSDVNAYANAGLLNKEYADKYGAILSNLDATNPTWENIFPYATQPLVIYNDGTFTDKSYGFVGPTTTISANSEKAVSLHVKTSANATAGIYLVDMSDDTRTSLLSIGRNQTYWYDENGNVCDIDPKSEDFDKNKNVALKLQPNGLYRVNPKWQHATGIDAEQDFANLANYKADADNNLLIADGGVSYEYTDSWRHEGNDGIAFYGYNATNKTAFADENKTVDVKDFSLIPNLTARHQAREATASNYFELNTNGELVEVNFFIKTGSEAKSYRLEVWSGTRDGSTVNPANSYVYFDIYGYPFKNNTKKYKEEYKQANDADMPENENYFENTFSFYDSAKFLRYNESLDENKVGNQYDDYDSTTYTTSVAYMRYEHLTEKYKYYEIFTDYSTQDVVVETDKEDVEEDTSDDTTNEATDMNPWLLISSIAVAGVLIFAVTLIVIRKSISFYRKKHGIYKK